MWEYGVVRAKLKAICMQTWALYTKNSHSSFAYNTSVPSKPYQLWLWRRRASLQNPINSGPRRFPDPSNPYQLWPSLRGHPFKTLSTLAFGTPGLNLQNPINSGFHWLSDPSKPYQLWQMSDTKTFKTLSTLARPSGLRSFKTLSTLAVYQIIY